MENIQDNKWSWGGFMFAPALILASRQYKYLWLYLLILIPFLGPLAWIGLMIFIGLQGRQLIMASDAFVNHDEKAGFLKGLDHAGRIIFIVLVVILGLGLLFGLFLGGLFLSLFGHSMFNPGNWHGRI